MQKELLQLKNKNYVDKSEEPAIQSSVFQVFRGTTGARPTSIGRLFGQAG